MTVASTTRKAGPYPADGVNASFPFYFKVFQASDLLVVRTDLLANDTTLTLTTDYTVALNANQDANPGGTVTTNSAPTAGFKITIGSQVPNSQLTVLTNTGGFFPTVINDALDKLTILVQQMYEKLTRTLTLSISTPTGVSSSLPPPGAGKVLGWSGDALSLQNYDPSALGVAVSYAQWRTQTATGNGAAVNYVLTYDAGNQNNIDCTIGGVSQTPGVDFTYVQGTQTVTFAVAPPNLSAITFRYGQGLAAIASGAVSGSSRTVPINVAYAANVAVDASLSNVFYIGTLTGNTTLAINNPSDGQTINIRFAQDGTGGRTVTLPGSVSVNGSQVTTTNYVSWLILTYVQASSRWEGIWSSAPTTVGNALVYAADAAAARNAIGLGTVGGSVNTASNAVVLDASAKLPAVDGSQLTGVGVPRSYLAGLNLSTAGASTTMTIGAGAAVDSTNAVLMSLASSINKTTSAWTVGTGNGGLDTGAPANNTWYHFYAMRRPDTQVVDACFSLSASAPTTGGNIPAAYTQFRRIGSAKTNGSGQWTKFIQDGDFFQWDTPVLDVDVTNPGSAAVTRTLSVPTGVNVLAQFNYIACDPTNANYIFPLFTDLAISDIAPSLVSGSLAQSISAQSNYPGGGGVATCRTNTSSQIRSRLGASPSVSATTILKMSTTGWFDSRGKNL